MALGDLGSVMLSDSSVSIAPSQNQ